MNWVVGIGLLVIAGFLLERGIHFCGGVHLGPRVQAWLYDRWPRRHEETQLPALHELRQGAGAV